MTLTAKDIPQGKYCMLDGDLHQRVYSVSMNEIGAARGRIPFIKSATGEILNLLRDSPVSPAKVTITATIEIEVVS